MSSNYKDQIIKSDLNSIATFLKISGMLLVFIGAVSFFIYETKGLSPRVTKLEQDFANTKKELSEISARRCLLSLCQKKLIT